MCFFMMYIMCTMLLLLISVLEVFMFYHMIFTFKAKLSIYVFINVSVLFQKEKNLIYKKYAQKLLKYPLINFHLLQNFARQVFPP